MNRHRLLAFLLTLGIVAGIGPLLLFAIESPAIRRIVPLHGVLSFFFNLSVLALTVSMISNLIAP
jgi:uncharacterized membrane protein